MTNTAKKPERTGASRSLRNSCGAVALFAAVGALSVAAAQAPAPAPAAQTAQVAPLKLPLRVASLINHTGISVEDVTASATFYSKLFGGNNVGGEMVPMPNGQPPSARYFLFVPPASVAIGKVGTLGSVGQTRPLIDHIAITAVDHDSHAWQATLKAEGLRYIASEVFLDFQNIPIQVAGGQGGEGLGAPGAAPAKLPVLFSGEPLVKTLGFDHVMLRVTDVPKTLAFWKKMFGVDAKQRGGVAWMSDGKIELGVRQATAGEMPGYEYQAFRIATTDRAKVVQGLKGLKATVLEPRPYDAPSSIRFVGPDGIQTVLVQVDAPKT